MERSNKSQRERLNRQGPGLSTDDPRMSYKIGATSSALWGKNLACTKASENVDSDAGTEY